MNIDIEGNNSGNTAPPNFPGIKLPNDGKFGFFQLQRLELSKQQAFQWAGSVREKIRPWTTFFATSRYKVPVSVQRLPRRVLSNLEYFQSNYLFVFIGLFLYCMITSPFLLLVVLALFSVSYWIFANDKLAVVFGQRLSIPQQYSLIGLCSMPILYIAGAGAALFWVIGASFFLIMVHATFYDILSLLEPEDEGFELTMEQVV